MLLVYSNNLLLRLFYCSSLVREDIYIYIYIFDIGIFRTFCHQSTHSTVRATANHIRRDF